MLKKLIVFSLLFTNLTFASTINIAVASNVSYVIDDLKKEFNNIYPNIKVRVTLGSSGKLTAQIKHGAPYHLFMSANMLYPNKLYKDKIAITKPIVYAQGAIALFSIKNVDFKKGIYLIKDSSIKRIAVANPKTAPYGIATKEALKNAKVYNETKHKFIYGESISQTVSYTVSATDIGFIAKSSLYAKNMKQYKKNINWIEINSSLYTPINQGIVLLKNRQNDEARKFYNFILSDKAKLSLSKFGYITK